MLLHWLVVQKPFINTAFWEGYRHGLCCPNIRKQLAFRKFKLSRTMKLDWWRAVCLFCEENKMGVVVLVQREKEEGLGSYMTHKVGWKITARGFVKGRIILWSYWTVNLKARFSCTSVFALLINADLRDRNVCMSVSVLHKTAWCIINCSRHAAESLALGNADSLSQWPSGVTTAED